MNYNVHHFNKFHKNIVELSLASFTLKDFFIFYYIWESLVIKIPLLNSGAGYIELK